ncbi:MAG: protein-L-isoaspartate(D-aspartate) O-methyltransferase [Chloroflexi bacterium]|nr:protein-L-isoaspartate(D-aspartate) O-methyltransferase [Chloroflexota bacterium]
MPKFTSSPEQEVAFAEARKKMVEELLEHWDFSDQRVLTAMSKVPRHRFAPDEYLSQAYEDTPLPISDEQAITPPHIVAMETQALALKPGEKVLEVGTGSGYQAAILAELTDQVYTVEIVESLGLQAKATLEELGYKVNAKIDDGYCGWQEHAPFDAIIVTCAPSDHIPQPLVEQLNDGGRLVIPIGAAGSHRSLWLIERKGEQLQCTNIAWGEFLPMSGAGEHYLRPDAQLSHPVIGDSRPS